MNGEHMGEEAVALKLHAQFQEVITGIRREVRALTVKPSQHHKAPEHEDFDAASSLVWIHDLDDMFAPGAWDTIDGMPEDARIMFGQASYLSWEFFRETQRLRGNR